MWPQGPVSHRLVANYGPDATVQPLQEELTKDCPHRQDIYSGIRHIRSLRGDG
jgi:hypothetical protein